MPKLVVALALFTGCSSQGLITADNATAGDASPMLDAAAAGDTSAPTADAASAGTGTGAVPVVATETCSNTFDAGSATYVFATHAFPGYTMQQLAAVRTIAHATGSEAVYAPPGFVNAAGAGGWVSDGAVAFSCGAAAAPFYDSVTFVLPQ
jgi:hypothetical protein